MGCGQLLREAGLRLMMLVMEEEAERLVGPRHQQDEQRSGYRWGNEAGYCVVDGQKVPIDRIRLRSKDGRELPPGSYQLFQRSAPLEKARKRLMSYDWPGNVRELENANEVPRSSGSDEEADNPRGNGSNEGQLHRSKAAGPPSQLPTSLDQKSELA